MYGTGVILSDFPIPRRNQQVCWRVGVLWNESKVSRNGNTEIYQITFLKYAKTKRGETMHKWDSSGRHTLHSKNTITFSFISCQEQNSPQCYVPVVIVGQIPMLSSSSFDIIEKGGITDFCHLPAPCSQSSTKGRDTGMLCSLSLQKIKRLT